jgi:hypothetical protein
MLTTRIDHLPTALLNLSRVQRIFLANAELFQPIMIFGPGLGSAVLLLGLLFRAGQDLFGPGQI